MNPSTEAIEGIADTSTDEVREAAQESIERLVLAVQLLAVAGDLLPELADGMLTRLKVISGAVNVLADRVE